MVLLGTRFENGFEALLDGSGKFIDIRRERFPPLLQVHKENRSGEIVFHALALIPVVTAVVSIEIALASIIICAA